LIYVSSDVTVLLKGTLFFPFRGFFNEVTQIKEKKNKFEKNLALVFSLYLFPVRSGDRRRQERRRRQEKASPRESVARRRGRQEKASPGEGVTRRRRRQEKVSPRAGVAKKEGVAKGKRRQEKASPRESVAKKKASPR